MMTESIALELKNDSNKIKWLLFTTILLALVNLVINKTPAATGSHQSTSVITSDAAKVSDTSPPGTRRDYLLVSEVALREGKSERTITDWIESGRIQPAPIKSGKEWRIAAEYRIPPQLTAISGTHDTEPHP